MSWMLLHGHSTRVPFLNLSPWALLQMPVSKLYLMFKYSAFPWNANGFNSPFLFNRVLIPNSDLSSPTHTILLPRSCAIFVITVAPLDIPDGVWGRRKATQASFQNPGTPGYMYVSIVPSDLTNANVPIGSPDSLFPYRCFCPYLSHSSSAIV